MEHTTGFEPVVLQFCRLLRWTSPPRVQYKGIAMFILQMNLINTKENKFFQDTTNDMPQFLESLIQKHNKSFFRKEVRFYRLKENDTFVLRTNIGIFKSVESARQFFIDLTDSEEEIRLKARSWNQENKILTRVEVINIIDNKSIRQLLNCLIGTCERFGGTCDEHNGCSTVTFAKEYQNKKQFPIKVVVG